MGIADTGGDWREANKHVCASLHFVRQICILSTGDLPRIHVSDSLFANKFYLSRDRLAYGCLEQRLFNITRDLALDRKYVDTRVYEESVVVRHRLVV